MRNTPKNHLMELFAAERPSDRTPGIRLEDAQVYFEVGDRVGFLIGRCRRVSGVVEKLNPKRARVRCGDGVWGVPYIGLVHLCASTDENRRRRARRLVAVAEQARELMDRHGLADWGLRFTCARTKLGECRPGRKLISLSRMHAVNGPAALVTDTILHEIAHALAGPGAGHGPAWKVIARRLGATPKSCAPESDEARRQRASIRAKFRVGDTVSFVARNESHTGAIVRLNPKRAKVKCENGEWSVPYARLSASGSLDDESLRN